MNNPRASWPHFVGIVLALFVTALATSWISSAPNASAQSIPSQSPWFYNPAGQITQIKPNTPIKITGLTPGGCVQMTSLNIATTTGSPCGGSSAASSTLLADSNTFSGSNRFATTTIAVLNAMIVVNGWPYAQTNLGVQQAIDACILEQLRSIPCGGVYLAAGLYILNIHSLWYYGSIHQLIGQKMHIQGAGIDITTIKVADGALSNNPSVTNPMLALMQAFPCSTGYTGDCFSPAPSYDTASSTIDISDLTIDGNGQNNTSFTALYSGISLDNISLYSYVHNVKVQNVFDTGASLAGPKVGLGIVTSAHRTLMQDNFFVHNDVGVWLSDFWAGQAFNIDTSQTVDTNQFFYSTIAHVYAEYGASLTITNNTMASSSDGIYGLNEPNFVDGKSVISGNKIATTSGYGIIWHGGANTIGQNTLTNIGAYGIQVFGYGNTVTGNTLHDIGNQNSGVNEDGIFVAKDGNVVGHNTLSLIGRDGIRLQDAASTTVDSNTIRDAGQNINNTFAGVNLQNSSFNTLSNNIVSAGATTNKIDYGLQMDGTSNDNNLIGNSSEGQLNSSKILNGGTNNAIEQRDGSNISFYGDNGKYGFGTANPLSTIHIVTPDGGAVVIAATNNNVNSSSSIEFKANSGIFANSNRIAKIYANNESGGGGDLFFQTAASGLDDYSTKLAILRNGNVGIGSSTPAVQLAVVGTENAAGTSLLTLDTNSKGQADGGPVVNFVHGGQGTAFIKSASGLGNVNPYLSFGIALNNNTPTEAMRLTENGYLTIGSTTANAPLSISDTEVAAGTPVIYLDTASKGQQDGGPIINFAHGAQAIAFIKSASGSGNLSPYLSFGISLDKNAPIEAMRLSENGYLGIGTTSPRSALSVQGNQFIAGNITSTSSVASIFPYASTTALSASNLVSGNCMQASTGGLLTTTGSPCDSASGSVTSVGSGTGLSGGPITMTGTLYLPTIVGTSTAETNGQLAAWGTTSGTPAKLYSVATTAVACSGNISCTGFNALGSASTIAFTGTLPIANGGTGQTSFGQGWLSSNGTSISASTSPTVNYIVATSTAATSTFAGPVQIGATASNNLFDVYAGQTYGTAVATDGLMHIENTANSGIGLSIYSNKGSAAASLVSIKTANTGFGQVPVTVSRAGNSGATKDTALRLSQATGQADEAVGIDFYNENSSYQMAYIGSQPGGGYNAPKLFIDTSNAAHSLINRVVIDNNGNFGLGTTSPATTLSVQGNQFIAGNITSTSTIASIFPYASTTGITSSGSTYLAGSGGNVGIGTSSPMAQFAQSAASSTINFTPLSALASIIVGVTYIFEEIDAWGHLVTSGPAPTVSGGTSSVAGNDRNGTITVTGTLLTSITLTFSHAYAAAPDCTMSDNSTTITADINSISATQVVFGFSAGINSGTVWYICQQHQ